MPSSCFQVVIPARLASTRLPEKVLRPIAGRPLIQYTHDAAMQAGADSVVIATDHPRVADACIAFGADVQMTSAEHQSGTDRIQEVAVARAWSDDEIVVNVQGDEPLMPPVLISQAASLLEQDSGADIATLSQRIEELDSWLNPNVVKVVCDHRGRAHYFSRAPIPWQREGTESPPPRLPSAGAWRHIGIYAYRVRALHRFSALPPAPIEQSESLEQLRALWNGLQIVVGEAAQAPPHGVDTEADLQAVIQQLSGNVQK